MVSESGAGSACSGAESSELPDFFFFCAHALDDIRKIKIATTKHAKLRARVSLPEILRIFASNDSEHSTKRKRQCQRI
jgi:hypothetical protein